MTIDKKVLVAVTGASGAIYAERLLQELTTRVSRVYLVMTDAAKQVVQHELSPQKQSLIGQILAGQLSDSQKSVIRYFSVDDLFAPVASGSSVPTDMIVVPCSMGSLARIATGQSTNLLERSADVVLKQKKNLIICPRETPLSQIHLENMLSLSKLGVQILPLMPAFYQKAKTVEDLVDFLVGRMLEGLGLEHQLYVPWNSRMR